MNTEAKNEQVKRQFFRQLREAKRLCQSTVDDIEKAIIQYQKFSNNKDFEKFSSDTAIEFKEWLRNKQHNSKPLAIATQHTYLRHVEKFFAWLSQQPGYKSKFTLSDTEFLHMSNKDSRIAAQATPRPFPTLKHILILTGTIQPASDTDLRDRALIALAAMTGIRDKALASLPFGSFDENLLTIYQNPKRGVLTKASKNMATVVLNFDDKLMDYFMQWIRHLRSNNWDIQAPLFPSSKLEHGERSILFTAATTVTHDFWSGAGSIRAIFEKRAKQANLPYFPPHCFKHFAIAHALQYCKSGEEIKAISQNFGHEHVATTLSSYGNYQPQQLSHVLRKMTFSGKARKSTEEKVDEVYQFMEQMKTKLTSQQ